MSQEQLCTYAQSIYRFLREKKMLRLYYERHSEAIKRGNANRNMRLIEALKLDIISHGEYYVDIPKIMISQIAIKGIDDAITMSLMFEQYNIRKLGYKKP